MSIPLNENHIEVIEEIEEEDKSVSCALDDDHELKVDEEDGNASNDRGELCISDRNDRGICSDSNLTVMNNMTQNHAKQGHSLLKRHSMTNVS